MKKQAWLKILNAILPLLVLWQVITSFFRAPLGFKTFGVVHPVGGFLLVAVVIAHVALNWSWVKNAYFRRK